MERSLVGSRRKYRSRRSGPTIGDSIVIMHYSCLNYVRFESAADAAVAVAATMMVMMVQTEVQKQLGICSLH